MLTKHVLKLDFVWLADHRAIYSFGWDELNPQFFELDEETWRDMEEPRTITMTLEPGDSLNS